MARVKRKWKIPDYESDEEVEVTAIKTKTVEDQVELKLIEEQLKYDEIITKKMTLDERDWQDAQECKDVTESAECHFCLETIEDKEPRTFATPCCNQKVHCSCFEHWAAKRKKQRSSGKNPMLQNNNTSPMHQRSSGNVDSSHKLNYILECGYCGCIWKKNTNIFM